MKSEESKKLEAYAKEMPGAYDDFISFMGRGPQRDGVDKELVEFIDENPGCSHDDILEHYYSLTILRDQ